MTVRLSGGGGREERERERDIFIQTAPFFPQPISSARLSAAPYCLNCEGGKNIPLVL